MKVARVQGVIGHNDEISLVQFIHSAGKRLRMQTWHPARGALYDGDAFSIVRPSYVAAASKI
jgi:hypothetical protein